MIPEIGQLALALALCFVGSAAIELSQREFLPTRVATVADVQHNVLGAVVGVLIAATIRGCA